MSRTSLLYFAPRVCLPPDSGAKLRNYHLMRQLSRWAQVTHLGFSEKGTSRSGATDFFEDVVGVAPARRYTIGKLIRGAIGPTPLPVLNYTNGEMKQTLRRLLKDRKFDVVQLEGVHLAGYVELIRSAAPKSLLVCDWHNIESDLIQSYGNNAPRSVYSFYAGLTADRMRRAERRIAQSLDGHFAVSESDAARLRQIAGEARIRVVPNGVDVDRFAGIKVSPEGRSRIIFVGSLDYHANIDAVKWFVREAWSGVHRSRPELKLSVIGRNAAAEVRLLEKSNGVEIIGTVDDVACHYQNALVSVVPLRVGGGSRLKILEAMAAGVPVISTRLGAEGLDVTDGHNIILADSPSDMIRAILDLTGNTSAQRRIAAAGLELVRERYDWSVIGQRLIGAYESLLDDKSVRLPGWRAKTDLAIRPETIRAKKNSLTPGSKPLVSSLHSEPDRWREGIHRL